ncbi:MAG TPA: hypothetical protein VHM19_16725 [Polyangiales bacterium]|jgi:hypothetical protein|nr:hypothetical protein [Polyangiales bacterium]
MTKLADFLKKQKIDSRRVLVASKELEQLRREDRVIKLAKKTAKSGDEAAKEKVKETAAKKPRSGRPVSGPTLARALAGGSVSGAAKTRITRAVNAVLTTKKKNEAALRDLF